MTSKDPITCHVLDTLTGRPAANIEISLSCLSNSTAIEIFSARTDSDGRVTNWNAVGHTASVADILDSLEADSSPSTWKLTVATGKYYGEGKTFWPQVDLSFYVKHGEHYHVPLLLGPYSYTTYRGS
ncbi:MAG: hypothetical protein M1818_004468 [Claussenomyces sp. TS43310]|nr:MAG: hypothetical protein M1818_004468 [Claussenomyces sp. TS43310]